MDQIILSNVVTTADKVSSFVNATATEVKDYTESEIIKLSEQIAAIEGEISSLTDTVETKADKATVDAALSAIEDDISALSAKEETDPVFTAWKDGESIALGNGATSSEELAVAIGASAKGLGYKSVAIGVSAQLSDSYSIAIGGDTKASSGGIAIGGEAITKASAIAIGLSASADENNGIAIGNNAKSYRLDGIAIGLNAQSGLSGNNDSDGKFGVVQIGSTDDFEQPVTSKDPILKVFKHDVLNANGKLVTANLAGMDTLKTSITSISALSESNNIADVRIALNAVLDALKTFVG